MCAASPSHKSALQHNAIQRALLEARKERRKVQSPEFQTQVAKAEGNLQLINMVLMSFSAKQNSSIDQRACYMHVSEPNLTSLLSLLRVLGGVGILDYPTCVIGHKEHPCVVGLFPNDLHSIMYVQL
ncbi:hypothetical protein LZ30DRAFT_692066 [Colletotrichum cereale]|nr:hypothetical protein LZ30DRAFT_692066 [Colletotrichum cereale]